MARITVEDCIDKFPSRFELVLVASQRARKLHSGEQPTVEKDNDKNTVIALREIADNKISVDQMKENLIEEFQTVTIDDEEIENSAEELAKEDENTITNESIDANKQIDNEIKELSQTEEEELKEEFEITDDLQNSENTETTENIEPDTTL